jgi:glycosyltransferase involved in cell wall biosynthesis/GT2 family glycosyltransferase
MPALIASYTSAAGGAERLLLDVATGLDAPPLIACPAGWLADEARAAGFTVFELPARSLHVRGSLRDRVASFGRVAAHSRELRRLYEDVRPSLVVAWGMRSAIATSAAMRRIEAPPPWIFEHIDFLPGPAIARAVRAAAARADRVVCVSHAVARDLDPQEALGDRIEVIHCGVDPARFQPKARGADADTRRDGSAEAILLGAIVPWKRPELALEIAALAAREIPNLRLRIGGAPLDANGEQLLARLRERAAQPDLAGRVDFTGRLDDPASALREADALLHCSDREPFGLVLVEALASGTPVVAPAAGGPAEIVDATCGALYPPGDPGAGARALAGVLRNSPELSAPARQRAQTAFSLTDMQARYRALLSSPRAAELGSGIAFVTVTYNSAQELRRLAGSIARHLPGARLVVVDNASGDDSRAVAEAAGATLLAHPENRGFGAAANAGVAAVTEATTVIVNPDVELVDDSLAVLAEQLEPGRLYAPRLLNADGSRQDSAHPLPASPATALYSLIPGAALPPPIRRRAEPWQSQRPRRVGWATAACLVARTDTLQKLGPFDESIFLYAEDLELGLRAETWFHPDARVIHTSAHSTDRAFGGENYELLAKQRRDVVRRKMGRRRAIVDDVIELMTFADRALLRTLSGRSARHETERFRARVKAAVTK